MDSTLRRPPLISLALASAAALAYQLLLIRVFSIIQWHHFAYMIISLALLGYGASGTFLSLVRGRIGRWLLPAYVSSIALFAVTGLPAFLLAQNIAFSPEELLWRPVLIWRLAGLYFLLGTPFFFVAAAVGLAFMGWGRLAGRVYGTDLGGAAAGGLIAVGLLWWMEPLRCMEAVVLLAGVAAFAAALETGCARGVTALFALLFATVLLVLCVASMTIGNLAAIGSVWAMSNAFTKNAQSKIVGSNFLVQMAPALDRQVSVQVEWLDSREEITARDFGDFREQTLALYQRSIRSLDAPAARNCSFKDGSADRAGRWFGPCAGGVATGTGYGLIADAAGITT